MNKNCTQDYSAAINRIKTYLSDLKRWDTQLQLFGAWDHQYDLSPPMDEKIISDLERTFEVRFPEDYRYFLLHCGTSGAGQGYGLKAPTDSLREPL
jgi:cell wall assembly regulator SMI1